MVTINILRKRHTRFIYENYSYKISKNNLEVFFDFRIEPDIKFQHKVVIKDIDKERFILIEEGVLDNFIFNLGLIEMLSYWKVSCSPIIEIKAGHLDKEQISWWKDLILNGMGQFFYENKIDFRSPVFLKILATSESLKTTELARLEVLAENKFLVLMGEGKDSIVSLELLKSKKLDVSPFIVNPTKEHFKILKIADIKNPIIIERKMDSGLLKLNQQGYLNGHTPITATISFLSCFCAVLFGFKNIVLSCERSANEGNVKYLGKTINHQWSKTYEFEKKFREYLNKYLGRNLNYFSFLRPLYEIQIIKIFSNFFQYFPVFLSCNEARKTNSGEKSSTGEWCCACSKCLFIFTILYPFIDEEKLTKIFIGQNLFEKSELLPIMKELIDENKVKPLECVGTKKETLVAFYLSWKKVKEISSAKMPFLLKYFEENILPKHPNIEKDTRMIMNSWNKQNFLSKELEKKIKDISINL